MSPSKRSRCVCPASACCVDEDAERFEDFDDPRPIGDLLGDWLAEAQLIEDEKRLRGADPSELGASSDELSSEEALTAIELRRQEMKLDHRRQVLKLRKRLARYAIRIVIAQLVMANLFFLIYLVANLVDPNPAIMVAWLSATVVEVIGILWVIARSLFPYRDKSPSIDEKKPAGLRR